MFSPPTSSASISLLACIPILGLSSLVDAALVANWKLDETSGQSALDSAGTNHGVLGNTGGVDTSDPLINQAGVFGSAYTFNSLENDRVDVSSSISSFSGLSSGSITGWFNISSTNRGALLNFGETSTTDRMILEISGSGAIRLVIRVGNTNTTDLTTSSTSYEDGAWHHVALINDGTGTKLYIDKVEVALSSTINSSDWFSAIGAPNTMTLGYEQRVNGTFPLNGSLDDFAVFDHALTTTELNNVYSFGAENYAVPEPSAMALLGLAALLMSTRRRRPIH